MRRYRRRVTEWRLLTRSQKEWETETEDDAVGIDVQLMGPTGTKYDSCDFEASSRKSLKKHVTTHVCLPLQVLVFQLQAAHCSEAC